MVERKTAEQGFDPHRNEQGTGEIGNEPAASSEAEGRLLFTNDCRNYFMFRLADEPVSS